MMSSLRRVLHCLEVLVGDGHIWDSSASKTKFQGESALTRQGALQDST